MESTLASIEEQVRIGKVEEASAALESLPETEENRADRAFLRGYLREMTYDPEGALEAYRAVLDGTPNHAGAQFRAAIVCDQRGDDEAAIELYEQCTAEAPAPINALLNLAILFEERGRLEEARANVETVLKEHPNHVRARQLLRSIESSFEMVYDEHSQREREKRDAILDTPITDFELSVRSRNCLRQMNIRTLGDLLNTGEAELLSYKNFGETSLNEIKALLGQRGLDLGREEEAAGEAVDSPAALPAPSMMGDASVHLRRSVAELELSVRSRKALQRLGIVTLAELMQRSEPELMAIKNFGQTSLTEIKQQLAMFGLSLRSST